jgi:hypothetical protein
MVLIFRIKVVLEKLAWGAYATARLYEAPACAATR